MYHIIYARGPVRMYLHKNLQQFTISQEEAWYTLDYAQAQSIQHEQRGTQIFSFLS